MKFGILSYPTTANIGDDIQSVAAQQFLPRTDVAIDREALSAYASPERTLLIMNGWFSHDPERNFPPAPSIVPVFVSFHMSERAAGAYVDHTDYFRQHGPIGCRDQHTFKYFDRWKVPAELDYCLTLTFPQRTRNPKNGKAVIVDARHLWIPSAIRRSAVALTHDVARVVSHATRLKYARELLEFYREEASVVITTKLHAALPCAAMGIPVVFFGNPETPRTAIFSDLGGRIYDTKHNSLRRKTRSWPDAIVRRLLDQIDWTPRPIDLGDRPDKLRAKVVESLRRLSQG